MEQQKQPVSKYYYSEKEWDRLGCGPLPAERNIAIKLNENKSNSPIKNSTDK
jgi:hypothetical protein